MSKYENIENMSNLSKFGKIQKQSANIKRNRRNFVNVVGCFLFTKIWRDVVTPCPKENSPKANISVYVLAARSNVQETKSAGTMIEE